MRFSRKPITWQRKDSYNHVASGQELHVKHQNEEKSDLGDDEYPCVQIPVLGGRVDVIGHLPRGLTGAAVVMLSFVTAELLKVKNYTFLREALSDIECFFFNLLNKFEGK